jgi:hypothetical protein
VNEPAAIIRTQTGQENDKPQILQNNEINYSFTKPSAQCDDHPRFRILPECVRQASLAAVVDEKARKSRGRPSTLS